MKKYFSVTNSRILKLINNDYQVINEGNIKPHQGGKYDK